MTWNPPNTVAINDRVYSVDLEGYRNASLPAFRQGVVTSGELSDQLFNSEGGWWRYRYNWVGGQGQINADLDTDADGTRYLSSTNVDVMTDYKLTLSPTLKTVLGQPDFDNPIRRLNNKLYTLQTVSGNLQLRTTDTYDIWYNTFHLFTGYTGLNTVRSFFYLADIDGKLFIADTADDLYYTTNTAVGGLIHSGTKPIETIELVNNNLLFGEGNKLYEIVASGSTYTTNLLYEHFDTEFRFNTIISVGSRIYVGGSNEDRTYIYATTVTSTGKLAVSNIVCDLPLGERLIKAISFSGNLLLLTTKGFRFATVTGDGSLTYGKNIDPFFAGEPHTALDATIKGSKAYVVFDVQQWTLSVAVADLENFVEPLTPAHSTYITAIPRGSTTNGKEIVFADAFTFLAFPGGGGINIYDSVLAVRNDDTLYYVEDYETSGSLNSGNITFGTAEPKLLGATEISFDALPSGTSVTATIRNSVTGSTIATGSASTAGQTTLELPAVNSEFNRCTLTIALSGDGTNTPTVRQWKMRAYPVAPVIRQWNVPILLSSSVLQGDGQGQVTSLNPWDEFNFLTDLWESREILTFKEGIREYQTRITDFLLEPTKWDDAGTWLEAKVTLQLTSVN